MVSCEKENDVLDNATLETQQEKLSIEGIEVKSENGYLVLNDFNDADLLAAYLWQISDEKVLEFCESHNFNSAYFYRMTQNARALESNDESIMQEVVSELKVKGYFNEEQSSLSYPFSNIKWATILNEDGMVMINEKLQRFMGADQIISKGNDIKELRSIESEEDYSKVDVDVFTQPSKLLKSISIPNRVGTSNLFSYVFESKNTVGGREYRRKTYLISYIYSSHLIFPSRYFVDGYSIYLTHELSQKILGIWWDYKDYLYYKLFDVNIGGNPISSDNSLGLGNHEHWEEHHNYPSTNGGVYQKSSHGYYILDRPWMISSYTLSIDDFNTPDFDQFTYEYWTNKVPNKSWMVF